MKKTLGMDSIFREKGREGERRGESKRQKKRESLAEISPSFCILVILYNLDMPGNTHQD